MNSDYNYPHTKPSLLYLLGTVGLLVLLMFFFFGLRSLSHFLATKDSKLLSVLNQLQHDVGELDSKRDTTGWEITEAEVEINFVATDKSDTEADIKAVGGRAESERTDSNRLVVKLRRVPVNTSPTSEPATNPSSPVKKK
jgi:hypothetical protein